MANQADFAPTLGALKDLRPFVFWAQTTLPTVFDDSLSYYEVLTKLCKMVNSLLENEDTNAENIEALATAYQELQDFTNEYFENLNVDEEISNKLEEMYTDGRLSEIVLSQTDELLNNYLYGEDGEGGKNKQINDMIAAATAAINDEIERLQTESEQVISDLHDGVDEGIENIPTVIESWMDEHLIIPSDVIIDDTLSIKDAAAEAYATGQLMDDVENLVLATSYWQNLNIDRIAQNYITADIADGANPSVHAGAPAKTMIVANVSEGETVIISGVASAYSSSQYIPAFALCNITEDTSGNPYYEIKSVYPEGWDADAEHPTGSNFKIVRNRSVNIPITGDTFPINAVLIMQDSTIPLSAKCSRLNMRTDDTLTSESLPAQGKATGDALDMKLPWPTSEGNKDLGTAGYGLVTNADGTTSWQEVGGDYDEDIENLQNDVVDLKSSLVDFNAYDYLLEYRPISKTSGGVTWVPNSDHSVTVSSNGPASSTTLNDLYFNTSALPAWVVPGKTYKVKYSSNSVDFRILVYKDGATTSPTNVLSTRTDAEMTIPSNATGLIIRYAVSSGTTVANETVRAIITNTATNKELASEIEYFSVESKKADTSIMTVDYLPIEKTVDDWEQGSISTGGVPTSDQRRIRTINWATAAELSSLVVAIDEGYKCALLWLSDNELLLDEYWLTGTYKSIKPYGATKFKIVLAKTDDSNIVPTEFSHISISGDYILREELCNISEYTAPLVDFPLFPYLAHFEKSTLLTSDGIELAHNNSQIRRSCVVPVEKSYQLELDSTDYLFRLYWKDSLDNIHSTAWGRSWMLPVNERVGITIKKANDGAFANTEAPEKYFRPYNAPKSYYLSEIEDVANRVKAANTEPGLCFLLSTDQHTMAVQDTLLKYDTISDMVVNMKALAEKINFDACISLGDIADFKVGSADHFAAYGVLDTTDYAALDSLFYTWMDDAMNKMASVHPNFIYVPGNHDDNRYINKDVLHENTSAYDYTPGEMYSYYTQRSQLRRVSNTANNGLDYYIDFPEHKIRMFCLDASHYYTGSETSPHGYHDCWWYGFQDATVAWMTEQLSEIPSGWSVLLLSHMSPVSTHNADNTAYINMANMQSVIQNFIDNGGSYIATLYGHSHVDWSASSPWLEISFDCQKCYNSTPALENMPGAVRATRTIGTATEDSWNVVIIQPASRKIKVIRFGAGDDAEYSY